MQVSRLEIKGFKSFGDRVVINFDNGITGIVGPNGCGKSNIVDAIRWVLGEQKTRNLRSDKMENVIFNGSKTRKPQQLAEVSITFDNNKNILPTEYSQVTVTRKYYRNGDSEYQLNGVTCRLKDINDLFLDTGIGSDSYAIIELKMVDEILNDKENSRRTLFEEAAGISKFKVRKKQTLRKLEETDADLARVEDVLFEIGKNLRSLERQAKIAERYLHLKDDYRKLSLEYARRNIEQHLTSLNRLEVEMKQETELKTNFTEELQNLEDALQEQKLVLEKMQLHLSNTQKAMGEQVSRIRQLENDIKLKSERVSYLKERTRTLRQQIAQDAEHLQHTQSSIEELQAELENVQEQYVISEEQVVALKHELQDANDKKAGLQQQFQELTAQQRNRQNAVFQLHKTIEINQIQLNNLTAELERMEEQHTTSEEGAREFEEKLAEMQEQLQEKTDELEAMQEFEQQLKEDILNTETEIQNLRTQLQDLNRKIDSKKNQYNLTKSLVDNLEGFPDAIKFLYKSKNWQKPAPLLSDLIVCQQEYKALVESYLEPYMNFFVVETVEDALEAIHLLNNQNKGRANFIVLSEIEDLDAPVTVSEGKNKAAMEVVSADPKYHRLIRYILNEVYISHDSDPTFYSGDHRTFILKDGSVIKKPLSISGGSVGLFDGNRIGRKQNLELLAKEIAELTQEAELLKSRINTQNLLLQNLKASTKQEAIKQLEREITARNQEVLGMKIRHEQHLLNRQNYLSKKEEINRKLTDLRIQIQEAAPQAEYDQQELERLEAEIASFQNLLNRHTETINEITAIFNQENIKFHQFKNRQYSLQQEINYKQKTVETNQLRLQNLRDELTRAEEEINVTDGFVNENHDALEQLNLEKESLSEQLAQAEQDYFNMRGEIDIKDRTIRELQRKRQNTDELVMGMQQKINEIHLKLVAVKERLSAEFNMQEEELLQVDEQAEPVEMPTEELGKMIAEMRGRLDNIGPVNLTAAEAYAEIEERNNFIRTQRDDLLNAKETLLNTINEIDTVAKEKYMNTFNEIKSNFEKVFRSLFSEEDSCDLVIVDPANPLDSKIEIMARPKGKRPLTINQLSGGEKTLTAISLLFAIYLIKPAPFCIFDEVDAPLDDANIDKFNNIIRTFSGGSQFIVVTHNKRTMASTDVMYGITMQEPGISKVIPVDLRQLA